MTAERPCSYRFVDLSSSAEDVERLTRFYQTLYVEEFPDPDEREALANMVHYLRHDGANGNSYIVTLVYDDATVVAGSIADYFVRSSCGAIEFLTVAPAARGRGLGARLARHIERRMANAAATHGGALVLVMAEMNDPFKRAETPDNLDPFDRLRFWHLLGYRRADFPYVQPALSAEQSPVANLLLAAKPIDPAFAETVPGGRVVTFLRDYLIYAMRFDDPMTSAEFVAMSAYLGGHPSVSLATFDAYLGEDPQRPIDVRTVETATDPDFAASLAVYRRAFANPELAVHEGEFVSQLARDRGSERYHLWAVRAAPDEPVCGMTSFFALPSAGFGGYVALEEHLLHTGRLRPLLARIERQLVGDGGISTGWYLECADDAALARFVSCGFTVIALPYRQFSGGPPLRLLYKEYGATFGGPPSLTKTRFLSALREIVRIVYGIERPDDAPEFAELTRRVAVLPGDTIPFRPTPQR